jgi:pilus assembly protein CpaC
MSLSRPGLAVITVQFKPFGVKLDFTPTITPQGSIDLKVAPEVSSLDYANAVTLQGFIIPALSQRRAETEVILKDGESFAIAGLIDNRVIETISKVPGIAISRSGRLPRSRAQKSTDELW